MVLPEDDNTRTAWRVMIWSSVAALVMLAAFGTIQLRNSPTAEDEELPEASLAIPSEWKEHTRVASPDRQIDAVMVSALPCAALQPREDGRVTGKIVKTSHSNEPRVFSLRLVAKGSQIPTEAPYIVPTRLFWKRTTAQSALVGVDAQEIHLAWSDSETIHVKAKFDTVTYESEIAEVLIGGKRRKIKVVYDLTSELASTYP